jgi:hypothetical protein
VAKFPVYTNGGCRAPNYKLYILFVFGRVVWDHLPLTRLGVRQDDEFGEGFVCQLLQVVKGDFFFSAGGGKLVSQQVYQLQVFKQKAKVAVVLAGFDGQFNSIHFFLLRLKKEQG